ncbi:MAG: DNA-binding protein [Rickettsiales bacterium]|nr:MAG: DNA-binding protein [Rickettsiales bacterium]
MANKKDLVNKLINNLPYLKKDDAIYAINCVFNYIKDELIKGNRIEIRGFGSLSTRTRKYAGKDAEYNTIYYRMSKILSANG